MMNIRNQHQSIININAINKHYQIRQEETKLMCRGQRIKQALNKVPQIIRYGSADIMLESSIKPQIKISTPSAIRTLKQVAFQHKVVSLSANQIGLDERVFVALKPQQMIAGQWGGYEQLLQTSSPSAQDAYEAIINPIEKSSSFDTYDGFQQCPSFPGLKFRVSIPIFSNIKYITEDTLTQFLKKQKRQANSFEIPESLFRLEKITGFRGRVWDHQIRHLEGILPILQQICKGKFFLLDDYKSEIDNINYFENLKNIQDNFRQKNLKKIQKEYKTKANSGADSFMGLSDIPETISQANIKLKQALCKEQMRVKKQGEKNKLKK